MEGLPDRGGSERWRRLIERREEQFDVRLEPGFWDRRASGYAFSMAGQPDPFLPILERWCTPRRTLIDAGAGTGRHAAPLCDRLDWVTAVEPSLGMREMIPPRDNLTVVAGTWEEAEVAPADLVICVHVLYGVVDPEPFIRKLEAAARERVFIYMRDVQMGPLADRLFEHLTGEVRLPAPEFADLWNLLRAMGIRADVEFTRYPTGERFPSMDAALDEARTRLGRHWDEERGRRWLESNLRPEDGGAVRHDCGEMIAGVAHWKP